MMCNILNDVTGYFHNNSNADCCANRHSSFWYGGPLYAIAFLLPWFPWRSYCEGDWLSGLHLVVSLCAFSSTLTFVQQAQCVLFTEIFSRRESRLQFIKINQVALLVGSTSILFCGLLSANMDNLPNFQAVVIVVAILAIANVYLGTYYMSHFLPPGSPKENQHDFPESEEDLSRTWTILLMRQILSQKNVWLFLVMSFFQLFLLTFLSNFMMIFTESLIPEAVLSSPIKSIMYGAAFICPQVM